MIGNPVQRGGLLIEITLDTAQMQRELWEYGARILALSLAISGFTACCFTCRCAVFVVAPMRRVIRPCRTMPKTRRTRRASSRRSRISGIAQAEDALQKLQNDLTGLLRQKERLAQLGGSVARISHDLRNMLTTASMLADRIEMSEDPSVKRAAPKLVGSLSRAINLCESTLAFRQGRRASAPVGPSAPCALGGGCRRKREACSATDDTIHLRDRCQSDAASARRWRATVPRSGQPCAQRAPSAGGDRPANPALSN